MNGFARGEVDGKGRTARVCGNVDALSDERFKVHLDAGLSRIPEHFVAELLCVKIGAQVAVQTCKNIQIEGCGSSSSIIVGGQQRGFGLVLARYQVGAEQQRIAGQQLRTKIAQNLTRTLRREVADAGAYVKRQRARVRQPIQRKRLASVISDLTAHGNPGNILQDVLASLCQ